MEPLADRVAAHDLAVPILDVSDHHDLGRAGEPEAQPPFRLRPPGSGGQLDQLGAAQARSLQVDDRVSTKHLTEGTALRPFEPMRRHRAGLRVAISLHCRQPCLPRGLVR
jgi:hypothetical protein